MDNKFIQSLYPIAIGISKNQLDPWELINGWVEYYLKNENNYKDHPNLKAIAVLKMKGLLIDHFRKSKKITSTTTEERGEIEFEDKTFNIEKNVEISEVYKKTLSIILNMGEKCKEILLLAADGSSMEEIKETLKLNSLGTALSRLSNCRKELRGLI
jgi:DNA-directed RNA polymerase specialized sigma24 family protein